MCVYIYLYIYVCICIYICLYIPEVIDPSIPISKFGVTTLNSNIAHELEKPAIFYRMNKYPDT